VVQEQTLANLYSKGSDADCSACNVHDLIAEMTASLLVCRSDLGDLIVIQQGPTMSIDSCYHKKAAARHSLGQLRCIMTGVAARQSWLRRRGDAYCAECARPETTRVAIQDLRNSPHHARAGSIAQSDVL